MQFTKIISLLAAAATAVTAKNIITLKSIDDLDRTVYFTANAGLAAIQPVEVPAGKTVDVEFPEAWIGNYFSVTKGAVYKPGMLGEVAFNGWLGYTYFDVSAIVDPNDLEGVQKMWPASGAQPVSGCDMFPCANAYYIWDDVQTKVTTDTHLMSTLGKNGWALQARELDEDYDEEIDYYQIDEPEEDTSRNVKRSHVEGKWFAPLGF